MSERDDKFLLTSRMSDEDFEGLKGLPLAELRHGFARAWHEAHRARKAEEAKAQLLDTYRALLEAMTKERDAALKRAEDAEAWKAQREHELDSMRDVVQNKSEKIGQRTQERDAALARAEAAERERDALRLELQHDDSCPQDEKPCLCCPCTCPTRTELRARAEAAEKERDEARARATLAETRPIPECINDLKVAPEAKIALTSIFHEVTAECVEAKAERDALRKQLEEARAEAEKYLTNIEERQRELTGIVDRCLKAESELAYFQEQTGAAGDRLATALADSAALRARCTALEKAVKSADQECEAAAARLSPALDGESIDEVTAERAWCDIDGAIHILRAALRDEPSEPLKSAEQLEAEGRTLLGGGIETPRRSEPRAERERADPSGPGEEGA